MDKINIEKVKLYAYSINPLGIRDKSSDLRSLFYDKMDQLKTVGDRMLQLNKRSPDKDCLLNKEKYGSGVFCTLARLAPGGTVGRFPEELLAREFVLSNELPIGNTEELKYKRITYAYISEQFVIINVYSSKNFETYLNEMLGRGGDDLFLFKPYIEQLPEVELSDVRRIRIGQSFGIESRGKTTWTKVKSISKELLNVLINEGVVADELINNNLISAEVNLKLERKPKEMLKEEYEKILSNAIALDADGISIEKKSGGTINAGDFHKRKEVKIELLTGDLLIEAELKKEMSIFAIELENKQK